MKEADRIREQVRRMRSKQYEPEYILVGVETYKALGKPRYFMGISVECDNRIKGFEVR